MEKSIRAIPAKPAMPKRLRVAAYARVSCDKESMLHSLAEQVSQYSKMIQSNPAWIYSGVYADEGLTGTRSNRPEFQRLLQDCRDGKIDMIITKSVSRFARNTVTTLETIRELKSLGVDVYFEENNVHSLRTDGEVLITVLSSFAQAESYSASENQKWRIRSAYQKGEIMNWRFMFGFSITKDRIEINEAEAEIVREIYRRVIARESYGSICRDLNRRGIKREFGGKWHSGHILDIVGNEKYAGNAMLQKCFVNNHLEKKLVRNNGELPKVFVEESHPAIIDPETFQAAQAVLSEVHAKQLQSRKKKATQCEFTGRIICPRCGKPYRHITSNGSTGWNCSTYMQAGKSVCWGKKIPDTTLMKAATDALGLSEYSAGAFTRQIDTITPYEGNRLVFCFTDGTQKEIIWKDRSRAESWTPEMREKARECAKRRKACPR